MRSLALPALAVFDVGGSSCAGRTARNSRVIPQAHGGGLVAVGLSFIPQAHGGALPHSEDLTVSFSEVVSGSTTSA